ncbi:MAG: ATP phosphoribosyltransferase [Alphaproteobacteria bacterium]|nr:ATP phosphoribosyltransferase [Alphaproteobacteria bacterium]
MTDEKLILAVPKGRILDELLPLLNKCGIEPEAAFSDSKSRLLRFKTNIENLDIIRVRAFDVATFTAFGAAHMGVVGSDVIDEFEYTELYAPVDLKIGGCRLSLAVPEKAQKEDTSKISHIRIATKYPNLTRKHFAKQGIQAECIKLNGAMEIAPSLGLADHIVDLVSTGSTLKANGLVETDKIVDISAHFVVNRTALKTKPEELQHWIKAFRENAR